MDGVRMMASEHGPPPLPTRHAQTDQPSEQKDGYGRCPNLCLIEWEGVPSHKVSLIPYGQTPERFDATTLDVVEAKRAELGMNRQLSLVCVSRLFHRKGHEFLFRALAPLVRDGLAVKLYLVGTGDFKEELERLTEELGIVSCVEFLGWRGRRAPNYRRGRHCGAPFSQGRIVAEFDRIVGTVPADCGDRYQRCR